MTVCRPKTGREHAMIDVGSGRLEPAFDPEQGARCPVVTTLAYIDRREEAGLRN